MPITLGCTACGKRFRARDESAGKKVKCPYCQTPVVVPTADEASVAPAPAEAPPAPVSRPASRVEPPPSPKVAPAADWGTAPPEPPPAPPPRAPSRAPSRAALPDAPLPVLPPPSRPGAEKPRPAPAKSPLAADEKTVEQRLAKAWGTARRGLGWVRSGLFFLALLGAVEFGKAVYVRTQGPLPAGDGADWVSIDGFVNTPGPNAIPVSKEQLLNLACYGPAFVLGCLFLTFGRLVASGAPRLSGARGLFALSSIFTFVWFVCAVSSKMFEEAVPDIARYARQGLVVALPLAEFLFLVGVTASGLALKRPAAARAVGLLGFFLALAGAAATIGWDLYAANGRPQKPDADHVMYEFAVLMVVWLVAVGLYWRAIGAVRAGAREFIETVEDKNAV